MKNNRLWIIGSAMIAIAIVVIGYVVGISPAISMASTADLERSDVDEQNLAHEATLGALKEQFTGITGIQSALSAMRSSIPASAAYSDFLGQLSAQAEAAGVTVATVAVSDAVPYALSKEGAGAENGAAPADESSTDAAQPASEAAPTGDDTAASEPAAPSIANGQLVTSDNFVVIPISVSVTGGFDEVMAFIDLLQTGDDRLFLVTGISVSQEDDGSFAGEIAGSAFVLTDPSADDGMSSGTGAAVDPADASAATVG